MTGRRTNMPTLLSVYDGRDCLGFILARGKLGYEAFDRDERTLGISRNYRDAANAISKAASATTRDL